MASTKVSQAIAALVAETQMAVVDKLVAFLGEKIEIDEDMTQYFEEFKNTLKEQSKVDTKKAGKKPKEEKVKRPPSQYNLYIRDKMAEFKAAGHSGNLMKMAIEAWNADKGAKADEIVATEEVTINPAKPPTDEEKEKPAKAKAPKAPKVPKAPKAPKAAKAPKKGGNTSANTSDNTSDNTNDNTSDNNSETNASDYD